MTLDSAYIAFPPFRLEVVTGTLWRGKQRLNLRIQAVTLLRYLLERPGQLVSKKELLTVLWADTTVSDGILKTYVWEIRRVLADPRDRPRFIETIPRRGYRFIGKVASSQQSVVSSREQSGVKTSYSALRIPHSAIALVGRDAELTQLHQALTKAMTGERQIVFVTGEPGIGKTTLVETFLQKLETRDWRLETSSPSSQASSLKPQAPSLWIGRGQCIEHYGTSEAYLPVLTALGRLCRESGGTQLLKLLYRHAPTWLVQLPALLNATERKQLEWEVQDATRGRMLRELAEAIEAITAARGLILWLDDLQWSDASTLDLVSFLAPRHERARLLIIGTYRPVDILGDDHPLRTIVQELTTHEQCSELQVGSLREADIAEYLGERFAIGAHNSEALRELAQAIHQRTEGNPLFMANTVDYLLAQGTITKVDGQWNLHCAAANVLNGVPPNIQQLIERQIERVSRADQRALEVASVAGAEFSAAAVAAGLAVATEDVEGRCAELARRALFLRPVGSTEWPDGTVAARYGFLHALYQHVLYERVPTSQRMRLHQRIGERLEQGYGTRARGGSRTHCTLRTWARLHPRDSLSAAGR